MNNQELKDNRNTNYYNKGKPLITNQDQIDTSNNRIILPSQDHLLKTGNQRNRNTTLPFIRQHLSHSPILQSHQNQISLQPQFQRTPLQINERRMSFTMFSPNATTSPLYPITSNTRGSNNNNNNINNSTNNVNSPPTTKKLKQDDYLYHASTLPPSPLAASSLQPNMSYTRRSNPLLASSSSSNSNTTPLKKETTPENENEDERFLRLARDALVATARGINQQNRGLVDPTISDLLTRLQYASSPHGNPISKSENLQTNLAGQLNIQEFYESFPNLSNDIFLNENNNSNNNNQKAKPIPQNNNSSGNIGGLLNSRHHPSGNESGWNFLIGEPLQLKADSERNPLNNGNQNNNNISEEFQTIDQKRQQKQQLPKSKITKPTKKPKSQQQPITQANDPSRKFLCNKCQMSFRRSSDLKRHEKQHLSIPPNICEHCGKGFARKDALKRHIGTLTCKRNADKKLYVDNLNYLKNKINNNQKGLSNPQYIKHQQLQQIQEQSSKQEQDEANDGDDDGDDEDEDDEDEEDEDEEDEDEEMEDVEDEERQIKKHKINNINNSTTSTKKNNTKNNEDSPKFPTYGYQKENW
ncbi:MET32 [Candida jiufengensis]|uniref:MET32 n=1 Tax=Candida jiufengensis TaxID=497108 RepID=UPI0022259B5A|nr:MET32 [Candida jiufengensis]KAI5952849.1 MET32 [Candida jiufengensis]